MRESYANTPKLDALAKWAVGNGAYIHESAYLISDPSTTNSGAVSTAEIPLTEKLLEIPHKLAITYELAATSLPQEVVRKENIASAAITTVFLCLEWLKGETGFWWRYIDTLPSIEEGCGGPLFLKGSQEREKWLGGTNLGGGEVDKILADWRNDWEMVVSELKQVNAWSERAGQITWELYLWAASMFSSRAFPDKLLRWDGPSSLAGVQTTDKDDSKPALFPLLDVLNHKPRTSITWAAELATIGFRNNTLLGKGETIWNNYGPKPNEQLLLSYGFAIEDNIDDTVLLKFLPALSGGQLHLRRRQILEEQDTGLYHLHKSSPHPPLPLIHLFHILVANPREIEILQQNPTIEIVSLRNEVATKKQLVFALNAKYNRISDERENPHTNAEQFITIYRRGQCDILLDALTMLRNETKQIMSRPEVYPLAQLLLEQPFRDGIEACFGDIGELAENGLEDKVFVLGLCRKYLDSLRNSNRQDNWSRFFEKMGNAYSEHIQTGEGGESQGEAEEFYDDMFPAAAEAAPEVFGDGGGAWTVGLVTWMMKIYQGEVIEINNGYYLFMD